VELHLLEVKAFENGMIALRHEVRHRGQPRLGRAE
jgi:hypothetical protein